MTESVNKGKRNIGTVELSGRGSRSASRSIQKYIVLSVMTYLILNSTIQNLQGTF